MTVQTTFKFNELSDNTKGKARQDYRNARDYYFESEFVSDDMETTLKEHGFELSKKGLSWDLSYSQGDYVGICGELTKDKLHELMMGQLDKRDKKKYYFWVINRREIEIVQKISHHHYYGQQVDVSIEYDSFDDDEYFVILRNFADKLECAERVVKDYVDELIRILKKQGYEQLSYYDSDEYIDEYYINNDYEFDEDGSLI